MESISRRDMLAATAAGGLLTAASVAAAQTVEGIPQPRRPDHGGTDPGPRNLMRDGQNPDLLVPPATDHGSLPNLRFSFSDAPMQLETCGWTRQVTARDLGVSKNIAGVNMRLNRGGVRELHWHKAAEWAYILYGNARITAVDAQGRNFVDDVGVGDLWYSHRAFRTPSRASSPTVSNSFWFSMMATSTKTTRSMSAIGSRTRRTKFWGKISARRPRCSAIRPIPASAISLPLPCRGRSARTRYREQLRYRRRSATG